MSKFLYGKSSDFNIVDMATMLTHLSNVRKVSSTSKVLAYKGEYDSSFSKREVLIQFRTDIRYIPGEDDDITLDLRLEIAVDGKLMISQPEQPHNFCALANKIELRAGKYQTDNKEILKKEFQDMVSKVK